MMMIQYEKMCETFYMQDALKLDCGHSYFCTVKCVNKKYKISVITAVVFSLSQTLIALQVILTFILSLSDHRLLCLTSVTINHFQSFLPFLSSSEVSHFMYAQLTYCSLLCGDLILSTHSPSQSLLTPFASSDIDTNHCTFARLVIELLRPFQYVTQNVA